MAQSSQNLGEFKLQWKLSRTNKYVANKQTTQVSVSISSWEHWLLSLRFLEDIVTDTARALPKPDHLAIHAWNWVTTLLKRG